MVSGGHIDLVRQVRVHQSVCGLLFVFRRSRRTLLRRSRSCPCQSSKLDLVSHQMSREGGPRKVICASKSFWTTRTLFAPHSVVWCVLSRKTYEGEAPSCA